MSPESHDNLWTHNLARLRWLGIWLPVAAIAVLIIPAEVVLAALNLSDLAKLGAHALLVGLIAAGAYLFSTYVFNILQCKEGETLQKQREVAARERHFRALLENSTDGILQVGADFRILSASSSITRLFGHTTEELLGRSALEFIHPEDLKGARARFAEALQYPGRHVTTEYRSRHKEGTWRWNEALITNLLGEPNVGAIVSNHRDVTERKQAEEALREAHTELEARVRERTGELVRTSDALRETLAERQRAEEALRANQALLAETIASALDAIITIDEDQRIVVFNAAAERMFRVRAGEVIGQPIQQFIPEQFRPAHEEGVRDFARTNLEKWWVGMLGGAAAHRRGGEAFPFEAAISQVEVGGKKLFTIILHDTTEQREAEEQLRSSREDLRALFGRLQSAREEERGRIAREIHATVGQTLACLKIELAWMASRLTAGQGALADRVKTMLGLTNSTIHSVRRIATDLRPGVLDDLGLVAALEWQAQEFQTRTGIACQFTTDQPDLSVGPAVATAAFRICQEALTNVARHAQAMQVTIRLHEEANSVILTLTDNGRGISGEEVNSRTSFGLLGMRERALLLGGHVAIDGRPSAGTTITVRLPLVGPALQNVREEPTKLDSLLEAAP